MVRNRHQLFKFKSKGSLRQQYRRAHRIEAAGSERVKLGRPEGLEAESALHFDLGTGAAISESSLTQPFPHFPPNSALAR